MKTGIFILIVIFSLFSCERKYVSAQDSINNKNYVKAQNFRDNEVTDSAFLYYSKAKSDFQKSGDTTGIIKSLINMAIIQTNEGDYYGGIETSLDADKYIVKKDSTSNLLKASNYNNLAIASTSLKNYEKSIDFYLQAIHLTNNEEYKLSYYTNIGDAYILMGDNLKARKYLGKAMQTSDSIVYARALNNYIRSYFHEKDAHNLQISLLKALNIRKKMQDEWGINSSYATLADYYYPKDKTKSLWYARQMLSIATELQSPDDRLEAMQKLILLETPEKSREYFQEYQQLSDSIQTARAKAKNQFALIRYETEKEKAENAKKQNHILKQYIAIAVLVISIIGGWFLQEKRKKRLRQEKEIEVKNTQLKYSRRVHDVVANGLYHTMVEIQNSSNLDKDVVLNHIEKMYEESRDIARDDLKEFEKKEFSSRLYEMLNSYSSENQKVLVIGNHKEKWNAISEHIQSEVFFVLREAMTNMIKHSKTKLVSVKIEKNQEEDQLIIKYVDNGTGIENRDKITVSGIRNMENRIEAIGGTITFEKNPKGGLIIHILIPIENV